MNGGAGELGVVGSHYTNDLYCQWQITVETGKVTEDDERMKQKFFFILLMLNMF